MDEKNNQEIQKIDNDKIISAVGYVPLLFLLPLFVCQDSKFAKFHANQSLLLLIVNVIGMLVIQIISKVPLIGGVMGIIGFIWELLMVILIIKGAIDAIKGKQERFPIFGQYDIIK